MSWKKSLLLAWEVSGLLVNTLDADEMYPFPNRDKLKIPIQMQLSQKQKTFPRFFSVFFQSGLILENFEKKR